MKITINPKGLIPDDTWQIFRKVRAIIENNEGCIAISVEGGKCIFPGRKCEKEEDEQVAIVREIEEETGIKINTSQIKKILDLETIYDNFYDYRTKSEKPRHTLTTYYYVKTSEKINEQKANLTEGEIEQNFKAFFVDRKTLLKMLMDDHSKLENGKFFDEENKVIINHILKNR